LNSFFEEMGRFIAILIVAAAILSGCYNRHSEAPATEFAEEENTSIGALRKLCADGLFVVESDFVCVGRVTSSDREGNFYRSIVVEDESGAVEIKLGIYNSAVQYPVGVEVALLLNNTAMQIERGVVQIGLPPHSFDETPREMESQEVIDSHIVRSSSVEPTTPLPCNIPSLEVEACGRFIAIEGLRYAPLEGDEETLAEGYYRFADGEGNTIFVYISPFADFAESAIDTAKCNVQGILYHEVVGLDMSEEFVIRPRFKDDIATADNTI
jgi:hypothetical protein